jgi:hypothetical protein
MTGDTWDIWGMTTLLVETEKCRVCGCTELRPCLFSVGQGNPLMPCSWLDLDHTLCTNPRCVGAVPLAELDEMVIMRQ